MRIQVLLRMLVFMKEEAFLSYPNLGIRGHCRVFAGGGMLVLRAKIALQAADLALVPETP